MCNEERGRGSVKCFAYCCPPRSKSIFPMGDNVTSNRREPPRVESFIPLNNAGISQYIYSLNHTRNDMQKNKNVAAPADIKGSTPPLVGQTVRGSISVNSTARAVVRSLPLALLLSDQHPEWERSYRCTCVLSLQYPPAVAVAKMVSFLSLRMVSDIYTPGCLLLCFLILVIFWVSFSFSFFFLPFFLACESGFDCESFVVHGQRLVNRYQLVRFSKPCLRSLISHAPLFTETFSTGFWQIVKTNKFKKRESLLE